MKTEDINNTFGDSDIELIDQILKGNFEQKRSLLDLGCGEGRNLLYFLQNDFQVYGIDKSHENVKLCQFLASQFGKRREHFICSNINSLPFEDQFFDHLLCSRVLHFCEDESSFLASWNEIFRVLKKAGTLYLTMNSCFYTSKTKAKNSRVFLNSALLKKMNVEENFLKREPFKTVQFDHAHEHTILILEKK